MKPSATQIFRYASPPTCPFLLGSCLFIGFLYWALIPMHFFVDFQVDWPMLLFRSRHLVPCRDIIHVATSFSRRDINLSLCSFELVSSSVATSIPCRNITLGLYRSQLFVPEVATSIPCLDTSSYLCSFQLMSSVVATSILCRDITSCLCRFQLVAFGVATSVFCRDNNLSHNSFIFSNLS